MRLLLDTHSFLWFINRDSALSRRARSLIEGPDDKLVSLASVWEMSIKSSMAKLTLKEPLETFIPEQLRVNGFPLLNIDLLHVLRTHSLPYHHRDPFDRLLAAQCLVEDIPIVSRDDLFDQYGVQRLW